MPQVIKTAEAKIVTQQSNSECEIKISVEPIQIEITVNVNSEGVVNMASNKITEVKEESTAWAIPAFNLKKLPFGK